MLFCFHSIVEEMVFFWSHTKVPEDWSKSLLQYQQDIDIILFLVIIWAAKKGVAYGYLLYLEHSKVGEIAKIFIFTKASFIISLFHTAVKCSLIFRLEKNCQYGGEGIVVWWKKKNRSQEKWILAYCFWLNCKPWMGVWIGLDYRFTITQSGHWTR